jgi:hypothetical protein
MTSTFDEKRECKLFSSLLQYLAQGTSAFALLNSSAQIDIESMAWNIVPENVKDEAIRIGAQLIRGADNNRNAPILGWNMQFKLIRIVDPKRTWSVISADTDDPSFQQKIAQENVLPIFHASS